ncbi:hypothetical protein HLPCO_002732, partial [Haloplasma contractile SSD-17B]
MNNNNQYGTGFSAMSPQARQESQQAAQQMRSYQPNQNQGQGGQNYMTEFSRGMGVSAMSPQARQESQQAAQQMRSYQPNQNQGQQGQ